MVNSKIIGYAVSGVGLACIGLSKILIKLPVISNIEKGEFYVIVAGGILVALGVALAIGKNSSSHKVHQASEEVPIYHGTGKNRKIVGYQKA